MGHSQTNNIGVKKPRTESSSRLAWLAILLLAHCLGSLGTSAAGDLPVISTGHVDIGVAYEDGAWNLHVHAEAIDMEFEPDAVWLKVSASSRTAVPSDPAFAFLGTPGTPVWMLPGVRRPDLLFLGLGTEELSPGVFSDNTVRLMLRSVEGPGAVFVYDVDSFGAPVVSFNSRDGFGPEDVRTLRAGSHSHASWVFTTPGNYRVGLEAIGVLAGSGEVTSSGIAEYLFDVADLPWLNLTKRSGHPGFRLEWQSETDASYQVQRLNAATGSWTDLGAPIAGTGSILEEQVEPDGLWQFYRVLVSYSSVPR
ncbi:MAG: choice-of-anchor M domain-containing protein [Verrucomicrobiia bacterium]